jgi:hypothetical protein
MADQKISQMPVAASAMKKLFLALCLFPLLALGQTGTKISQMPLAAPLTGAELVPLVQGGANVATPIVNLPGTPLTSPDSSICLSDPTGSLVNISVCPTIYSTINVLPGLYLYAGLPLAATHANQYASTTDQGAVYSNGTLWQVLYNATNGVLQISSGSPQPQGQNATPYSQTLATTDNIGAVTWTKVSQYAVTGTPNTFTVSSAGVLADGTEANNSTTAIVVQAVDSTGAAVQKTLTVTVVAALSPAATPTFSPIAGTYSGTQTVTISDATGSSTIYYTTNGSTPTTSSPIYTAPFTVSTTSTVEAIATASGSTQSAVGTAAYVIAPANANYVGMNLAGVSYFASERPFLNLFKGCGSNNDQTGWFTGSASSSDTHEPAYLQLDSDGYATSLTASPTPPGGQLFTKIYCIVNRNLAIAPGTSVYYPATTYRIQYTGTGSITVSGDAASGNGTGTNGLTCANAGTGTVSCTFIVSTTTTTGLQFTETSTGASPNYVRAISVVQNSLAASYDGGAIFDPAFLNSLAGYSRLRFMDWFNTNKQIYRVTLSGTVAQGATSASIGTNGFSANENTYSVWPYPTGTAYIQFSDGETKAASMTLGSAGFTWSGGLNAASTTYIYVQAYNAWANRSLTTNAFYGLNTGVPFEIAEALCNTLNVDCWLNIPEWYNPSTDATSLATLTQSTLNSNLKAYIEFGNEIWNGSFVGSFQYSLNIGASLFPGAVNQYYAANEWVGEQIALTADAWYGVYGSSAFASQVVAVWAGQGANTQILTNMLTTPDWTAGKPASGHHLGAISVAPYFIQELQASELTTLNSEADGGVSYYFQLLTSNVVTGGAHPGTYGFNLPGGGALPATGWMGLALSRFTNHVSAFSSYGVPFDAYEGGQALAGNGLYATGTPQFTLFLNVNHDSRMIAGLDNYFKAMKTAGMHGINQFNDCAVPVRSGLWGILESTLQPISPLASAPAKYQGIQNYAAGN